MTYSDTLMFIHVLIVNWYFLMTICQTLGLIYNDDFHV